MKKRILRPLPGMDLPFLVLVLTLVGFGLVMLGSASGAVALYRRGDAFAYLRPQLLYAALGIAGMGLASRETVSRALNVLLQKQIVEKDLRRLIVRQPDILRKMAQEDPAPGPAGHAGGR
jgi:hypothetical protein